MRFLCVVQGPGREWGDPLGPALLGDLSCPLAAGPGRASSRGAVQPKVRVQGGGDLGWRFGCALHFHNNQSQAPGTWPSKCESGTFTFLKRPVTPDGIESLWTSDDPLAKKLKWIQSSASVKMETLQDKTFHSLFFTRTLAVTFRDKNGALIIILIKRMK